jgi:catechol 2,3-dioxygenase-like lactoylglutathione lyase family enzyme
MSNPFSVHPDHLAINIQDLEKSLHFYGDILQLPKLPDVDMGDHHLYYFDLGNGLRLELIKYVDDFGETHPGVKTRGMYRHIGLHVNDVDALYKKMKEAGCKLLTEPAYVKNLKFRNFLAEDPNGVELEFVKRD